MSFLEILLIAAGLAMDAFAVCLGAASSGSARGSRATFRLAFHFGLFQFLMPVIGWYVGAHLQHLLDFIDHWIAFLLLAYVGTHMIIAGIRAEEHSQKQDPSKGWTLVMLSLATSIDALAVGFSLAFLEIGIWYPSVMIGLITAGLSVLAVRMGRWIGVRVGQRMEILGGTIINIIGIRILYAHLVQ